MQLPLTIQIRSLRNFCKTSPRPCRWRGIQSLCEGQKKASKLLRVVFFIVAWTNPCEVAGTFTALYESITDQSVAERLRACGPWVQALLRRMLPLASVDPLPAGWRFVVIDASSIQAPGATGTDHRLHIAMDET